MRIIESFDGNKKELGCLGCAMEKGELNYSNGAIIKTKYFDLHQDYEIPINGFLILSSRRHFSSLTDFSKEEEKEFYEIITKARKGMKEALGIDEVVLFQNEASDHHFHIWLFPFHKWMKEKGFTKKSYDIWKIIEYSRNNMKTKENIDSVIESVNKMKVYMNGKKR